MESSVTLGRVAGIAIGINWSWLIVLALVVWSLGANVFPEQNPGLGEGTYYAMAAVAAVLFFLSILLHELGHALQARREGMEMDGITLWLFGGVARFRGMFPSAGAEWRIAIAGPLVTLVLGGAFVLVGLAPLPASVDGVAAWLGYINLFVLVFNLLPALPLDGGRVLRAALWRWRGDFLTATRWAGIGGRGFAYLLIGAGIALVFAGGLFSGVWLVFIGWFLLGAVEAEVRHASVRQALDGLRVRDLMVRDPVTANADATLGELMDAVVRRHRYTTYPVVDADGKVLGLVPFRRVAELPRERWDHGRVRECTLLIARDEVPVLDPDDDMTVAVDRLAQASIGRGLVMRDGRLEGLLSSTDITRALEAPRPRPGPRARPRGQALREPAGSGRS